MDDLWTDVQTTSDIEISNAAPRITSRVYTPEFAYRGEIINASLKVEDGHGVESILIHLLTPGAELTSQYFDSNR